MTPLRAYPTRCYSPFMARLRPTGVLTGCRLFEAKRKSRLEPASVANDPNRTSVLTLPSARAEKYARAEVSPTEFTASHWRSHCRIKSRSDWAQQRGF